MHRLRAEGFVLDDGVEFQPIGSGYIVLAGRILCAGGIYVDVWKVLEVVEGAGPGALVQTVEYSYNAAIPGLGSLLRYDSPHPGHRPHHHVHRYSVLAADKEGAVEDTSDTDWPTLGAVLEELRDWYYGNYENLGSV
jgi:hypothetical protein